MIFKILKLNRWLKLHLTPFQMMRLCIYWRVIKVRCAVGNFFWRRKIKKIQEENNGKDRVHV